MNLNLRLIDAYDRAETCQSLPLHTAARKGLTKDVIEFIRQGHPANLISDSDYSPIHLAAKYGHCDTVQALLGFGVPANLKNKKGRIPLHYAAMARKVECCEVLLIACEGSINDEDDNGNTALHFACTCENIGMIKYLVRSGANLNLANKHGRTVLYECVVNTRHTCLELLLSLGLDLQITCANESILVTAVRISNYIAALMLVDNGAPLNVKRKSGNHVLLDVISTRLGESTAIAMINKGVDANTRDSKGIYVLHKSIEARMTNFSKLLINKGAMTSIPGILHLAFKHDGEIVEHLLRNGANIFELDPFGQTAFHRLVRLRIPTTSIFQTILDISTQWKNSCGAPRCGRTINLRECDECHMVAYCTNPKHCKLLRSHSMDCCGMKNGFINVVDVNNQTALHMAALHSHTDLMAKYIDVGADVTIKDRNGNTAENLLKDSVDLNTFISDYITFLRRKPFILFLTESKFYIANTEISLSSCLHIDTNISLILTGNLQVHHSVFSNRDICTSVMSYV